ncbi:MAG TPA: DUF4388 domain-containing protein [Planctomycetota bacterium]|nr:DUF4388 domain-containing protein [Planctomycetota bacterium]
MGLKGNLTTVNLSEVFQNLASANSTGLLRVQAPEGPRFVELQNGAISIAGRSAGRVMLGDLLIARGLIDDASLEEALRQQKESGKMLGEVLLQTGTVTIEQIENALKFQIEEEVCELLTLRAGDFDFLDGAGLDTRIAPAGGLVKLKLDLPRLLQEAANRAEEWKIIEQRIPSQSALFQTTADGDAMLQSGEGLSPEGMILLRLVKTHRTVEAMVQKACLGRFTTNRMLLELTDAGIIAPAPLGAYERVAREHLGLNRFDEAQRVAEYLAEFGSSQERESGRALVQEILKMRKPAAPTTSAYVKADPKVRSEVIRRNQPGLIIKKEQSRLPVILVVVLVLAGAGVGTYFLYSREKGGEYTTSRKELERVANEAKELIVAEKYREGLQLLRGFRSFDPDIQKQANELFQNRQKDVEAKLIQEIDNFTAAQKSGKPEELQKALQRIEPLIDIEVMAVQLEELRARVRKDVHALHDREMAQKFQARLKEIEGASKDKNKDVLRAEYEKLLAEKPPESIAATLRESILQIRNTSAEAARLSAKAAEHKKEGDYEFARMLYERVRQQAPGSERAEEAEKALAEMSSASAAAQTRFDGIQAMITQGKTQEAASALQKFLDEKPPQQQFVRALMALQGLSTDNEAALVATLKSAQAQYDKAPAEARKKIIELAEQNRYSRTAQNAALKVRVTSVPAGAAVLVNGKNAGTTPANVDVPALGLVRLTVSSEGFESADAVKTDWRDEQLSVALNRIAATTALLPAPARNGLSIMHDNIIVAGGGEAIFCPRRTFKPLNRIRLAKTGDNENTAPLLAYGGEVFIPQKMENALCRVEPMKGSVTRILLDKPATSTPILYETRDETSVKLLGLATESGFESYVYEDGKSKHQTHLAGAGSPPIGIAYDGEFFYLPRPEKILSAVSGLTGLKKWDAAASGEISGAPALDKARGIVAVAAVNGTVSGFELKGGKEKWKQELGGEARFGLLALTSGFLALQADGKVKVLAVDTGTPGASVELSGTPVLPAQVAGSTTQVAAILVATEHKTDAGAQHFLYALSPAADAILWRAALPAKAVALTSDGERAFVSTEDNLLQAYSVK